jgi:DNA polymerase I-like protein with 3'-5' exonuclease and polymerase domains
VIVSTTNIEKAMSRIGGSVDLTVDLETTGLRAYQGDRLFGIAVEAEGEAMYFPFRHRTGRNLESRHLPSVLKAITRPGVTLLGHNFIRFDVPMIAQEGDLYYRRLLHDDRVRKEDTIIDALLANENEPSFSLDALGSKYLGGAAAKHQQKAKLLEALARLHPRLKAAKQLMGHMADLPPEIVAPYACGDVLDTRALREKYRPNLALWKLDGIATEMYSYARLLAKIERTGLLIDKAECAARIVRCEKERELILRQIRSKAGAAFNPQSPQQVMRLCGTPDAEAKTLERSGHPLAAKITQYKRLGKAAATYYQNMIDRCDDEDVIHPQMNLTRDPRDQGGTRSGRLSCSNPNFQNLPKRSDDWQMRVREVVLARPGHKILSNDYERAEMWLGGHYSGDESLAQAYHAGRDLYVELSAKTDTDRQGAKIDWLAIQYGARGRKLSEMHNWPFKSVATLERQFGKDMSEWQDKEWRVYKGQRGCRVVDEFFDLCPGIKEQMKELEQKAQETGCIRLWTGRVVHFDGYQTPPFVAWNRLIQGGVGEMMRVAMQRLEEPLEDIGAHMLLQVHDEIVVEAPDSKVREAAKRTREVMTDFKFNLRPRVDTSVGVSYGKVSKLKEAA